MYNIFPRILAFIIIELGYRSEFLLILCMIEINSILVTKKRDVIVLILISS